MSRLVKSEEDGSFLGTAKQLQGIGSIIVAWNQVESTMAHMYANIFSLDITEVTSVFARHNNDSRFDLIELRFGCNEGVAFVECVREFCKQARTCVNNRNLIAHATVRSEAAGNRLVATKIRNKDGAFADYEISDEDLAGCSEEIYQVASFGAKLLMFAQAPPAGESRFYQEGNTRYLIELPTVPDAPRQLHQ